MSHRRILGSPPRASLRLPSLPRSLADHMFAVYNPDPGDGMGADRIVHYTSVDLKHWAYAEIARGAHGDPPAYDSDVFRVGDGGSRNFKLGF